MAKIVVISDDISLGRVVRDGLGEECGELISCGEHCLEGDGLAKEAPDLILLDMRLPKGQGVLARLMGSAVGGDVPVIAVGEYRQVREWATDLERGASDVLSLPIDPEALGARAKAQLRLKRRLDQLKAEAVVDELTGIFNRRFMESQLVAKLGEAWRYHHPFSFMILDFDHFKQVNDSLGHPFGDLVLREAAGLMRRMIRKEDIIARYGGEEFAFLLPHTDRAGGAVLGERVRRAVAEKRFVQGKQEHQVTISIGVATYPLDEVESMEQLLTCADQRLYRAKKGGRNQVVCE